MIGVPSSLENSNNTNENNSIEISNTTESKKLSTPPILNPKPKSQEKIILPIPEKFLQAMQKKSVKSFSNSKSETLKISANCDECGLKFVGAQNFNSHQIDCCATLMDFSCKKSPISDYCDESWKSATALCLHYAEIHQEKNEICGYCGQDFFEISKMENHIYEKHSDSSSYYCEFCDQMMLYSQKSLDNHIFRVHKIQVNFDCELCDFQCRSKSKLEDHIQTIHGSEK